jgi:hypothetical protein
MAINSFPPSGEGPIEFPDQLIDPVSKFRVSNPENLIDTDFEYGLQPTKWETVELINNTPSFFSKSGDTTIDGISSIITNAGTREIIVKTELDHGLAVGIPINVTGTKSITADGAYIINSIPDTKTFTYLCKDNQTDTNSILDLYSSIITGEFFQGSQLRISDSDGIVTDAEGTSILTVTTNTTHGFGENTPFYFLNLNSTVAQEFQAANTASKSFDASNSATAQTFDGSNSLSSVNIDWSNSATFGGTPSTISGTDQAADTITVTHQAAENFNNLPLGTPLYYAVSATGGYFNTNPRGVVFLKTTNTLGTSTSTFKVSLVPDGDAIDLTSNLTGTFQIANQARTFAGNNLNPLTQTSINIEVGTAFSFDGGNQGYTGVVQATPPNNVLTVLSYTGSTINADGASAADYYVGAMVRYSSTGASATELTNNATYFVRSVTNNGGGNYSFSVAALPGGTAISITTGSGSGTQTFSRIGISVDRDIVHIPNSNFSEGDMLEYTFPVDGRFDVDDPEQERLFYFVDTAYDSHNYKLSEDLGFKPIVATGGTLLPEYTDQGRTWRAHQFTTVGNSTFTVTDAGKDTELEYLIVAGGGGGGGTYAGGGGGGGFLAGSITPTAQAYTVTVGAGGTAVQGNNRGGNGGNSSAFGLTAIGGGGGGEWNDGTGANNGSNGGSGGGGGGVDGSGAAGVGGTGTTGQGFVGGNGRSGTSATGGGGGGGGAGGPGSNSPSTLVGGAGGQGKISSISGTSVVYAGGGGGGSGQPSTSYSIPGGGGGRGGFSNFNADPGVANRGGGGGGAGGIGQGYSGSGQPGVGGSGVVIVRYPITPPIEFIPASATGGTVTQVVSSGVVYNVHTFTTVGTSTFAVQNVGSWNNFEYMIIAGGGGGGALGGGGGAGGYRAGYTQLSATNYSVVVGQGGTGADGGGQGQDGTASSAFGISTVGGGGAGSHTSGFTSTPGRLGGSGGGGGDNGDIYPAGAGTPGQGFAGGVGIFGIPENQRIGGGGGGAGGVGNPGSARGHGGPGVINSILGPAFYWAAGGGAGGYTNSTGGNGGIGGGGGGTVNSGAGGQAGTGAWTTATAGTTGDNRDGGIAAPNTGSGGGGNSWSNPPNARTGAAGIVAIRYAVAVLNPEDYVSATGGTITTATDSGITYAVHQFDTPGTYSFTVDSTAGISGNNTAQYLIVGGGGAGGDFFNGGGYNAAGGGGGAGGVLSGTVTLSQQSYTITVGSAGVSTATSNTSGGFSSSGGNTTALGFTAIGGGRGGAGNSSASGNSYVASSGGSGGGGVRPDQSAAFANGAAGTSLQGNAGGSYQGGTDGDAAGGGGASTAGQNSGSSGGNGGNGFVSSITGTSVAYAAGGGGGKGISGPWTGLGGSSGAGGNGQTRSDSGKGGNATTPGSGGGGAGSSNNSGIFKPGGDGRPGIFIIRYPIGSAG